MEGPLKTHTIVILFHNLSDKKLTLEFLIQEKSLKRPPSKNGESVKVFLNFPDMNNQNPKITHKAKNLKGSYFNSRFYLKLFPIASRRMQKSFNISRTKKIPPFVCIFPILLILVNKRQFYDWNSTNPRKIFSNFYIVVQDYKGKETSFLY